MTYNNYRKDLLLTFWTYYHKYFRNQPELFDSRHTEPNSPPVFMSSAAGNNVLIDPSISPVERQSVLDTISLGERHRWFRSMSSSQALAQSVLGNLKVLGKTSCLDGLIGSHGRPMFGDPTNVTLEYSVNYLGEPRQTSIDVYFPGDYRIAVECKFSEQEVGTCSRPRLKNIDTEYCDGKYTFKPNHAERCPLTSRGVLYWRFIPQIFNWAAVQDYDPCPLKDTYQLVRNILTVCVRDNGQVELNKGHVVLLYDERNPEFLSGGKGREVYEAVWAALKNPHLIQECTWQQVITVMREDPDLICLTDMLNQKYGL